MLPLLLALAAPSFAQETVDIGVITDSDVRVVQRMLYPKQGRTELGLFAGWMPFDAMLTTPNFQGSFTMHQRESFALDLVGGVGYGLKNGTYKTLESPTYGIAPDAYGYLASALVGVQVAPIYGKFNVDGARVVHHDLYGALRGGLTVEQSKIPEGGMAFAPTLSAGVGIRLFTGEKSAIRFELRDDVLLERRRLTQSTHIKQNVNLTIGISLLSDREEGT